MENEKHSSNKNKDVFDLKKFQDTSPLALSNNKISFIFDLSDCYDERRESLPKINLRKASTSQYYISSEDEETAPDRKCIRKLNYFLRKESNFGCLKMSEKERLKNKKKSWQGNLNETHKNKQVKKDILLDEEFFMYKQDPEIPEMKSNSIYSTHIKYDLNIL